MANTKIIGTLSGTQPLINSVDYQCSKLTYKIEQKKIEYEALGQQWVHTIPGGVLKATGSFEMAADNTQVEGTSYVAPMDIQYVTFSKPLGTKTLTFSAVVSDVEVDFSPDLVTIKGNYQADGAVTYS